MSKIILKSSFLVLFIFILSVSILGQGVLVPVHVQLRLLIGVLEYDNSFDKRVRSSEHMTTDSNLVIDTANSSVHMMILYQSDNRKSSIIKEKLLSFIEQDNLTAIRHYKLETYQHSFKNIETFDSVVQADDIEILVIAPLIGVNWSDIFRITQQNQIMSFSTVPENIENGASITVTARDNSPLIMINEKSAKAEGIDFREELFLFSSVVKYNTE